MTNKEFMKLMEEIAKEVDTWSDRVKKNMEYLINDDYYEDSDD